MLNIIIVIIAIVALVYAVVKEDHNTFIDDYGYIVRFPGIGIRKMTEVNVQFVDKIKSMDARVSKNLLSKLIKDAAGKRIDEAFVGRDFDNEEFNRYAGGVIIDEAISDNNLVDVGATIVNRTKLNNMFMEKAVHENVNKLIDEAFLNMKAKAAASQAIDQAFYAANGMKKPVDIPIDFDLPVLMEGEVYMVDVPEF